MASAQLVPGWSWQLSSGDGTQYKRKDEMPGDPRGTAPRVPNSRHRMFPKAGAHKGLPESHYEQVNR